MNWHSVTWIHRYTPETKNQTKQWVEADGNASKKAKSADKVMASGHYILGCMWILLIGYLEKGSTVTGEYYRALFDQLNDAVKSKRSYLKNKKILFLQDNASVHIASDTSIKLREIHCELLPHSPYSTDLVTFSCAQIRK